MIQRIQTLYLGICAILIGLFLLSPLFITDKNEIFTALDCKLGLSFAIGYLVLAVISIFLYRKRVLQSRVVLVALVCNVLVLFFYSIHYYFLRSAGLVSIRPGALIPVVTLVFTYLAIRGIRKDEKLVRESDRLR